MFQKYFWNIIELKPTLLAFFKIIQYKVQAICKIKLANVVEGDPKAPLSIATTPRLRGGRYFVRLIATIYPWSVFYIAKC